MVTTIGPAVGAKAQLGYAEESKWGYPKSPPTNFFEFTSEGIVSEFTNLISAALRTDRSVHRQRIGTEAAGGDIAFEMAPEGYGTMFKHGLGKVRTKRLDLAAVLVYNDAAHAGALPTVTIDGSGITSLGAATAQLAYAFGASDTCQAMITALDGTAGWECFAPWGDGTDTATGGYFARSLANKGSSTKTLGTSDYGHSSQNHPVSTSGSVGLLEAAAAIPIGLDDSGNYTVIFPIFYKYGIYEHVIETFDDLPEVTEGITLEVGRDVAAFNYYGSKVNTLGLNATPGEFVTGTVNFMAKGASTVGDPVANSGNTGWSAPILEVFYSGAILTGTVTIQYDDSVDVFALADGNGNFYQFSGARGTCDHDGYYHHVSIVGGLVDFIETESHDLFTTVHKPAVNYAGSTVDIENTGGAQTIDGSTSYTFAWDSTLDASVVPLFRGDYIGQDAGVSTRFWVRIAGGGTGFEGANDAAFTNPSAEVTITKGEWHNILYNDGTTDIDTGFEIMFPVGSTLNAGDIWYIDTFKDENAGATYSTLDQFVGAQGSVTLDGSSHPVMGLSFTINNNLFGDKYELGDKQRKALKEQQMAVEGSITVEFDDLDLYRRFVNGVAAEMEFCFTSDEYITSDDGVASDQKYCMELYFPNLKYSGTTPVAGGPEIITTDFPFVALYDDEDGVPNCRVTLTNHMPYI